MKLSIAIEEFSAWKALSVKGTTIRGYGLMLRQMAVFLHDMDIERVKIGNIIEWFDLMQRLGWDRNSFIPRTMAVRKFFEYFTNQGMAVMNPWLVPVPNKEYKIARVADESTYRKLRESIPIETNDPRHIRNLAIVSLLWDTGARNGEICSIDTGDLDFYQMKAVIKTEKSKGKRPVREIFWTAETNDALRRWVEKREQLAEKMEIIDEEALFISICSQKCGQRFTIKGVGEMLRRYSNRARIPYQNAHSFRHHMGHHIVRQGGSNSDVSNILGHSSLASSFIYTQMTDTELAERYRKFMADKPKVRKTH